MVLVRLFASPPLVCPYCGTDLAIVAFIGEAVPVERILIHVGAPLRSRPTRHAREPRPR